MDCSFSGTTVFAVTLTNCGKDVGKAEVVHSVEREEMVEELLLLIITAQESVALIEFPSNKYNRIHYTIQYKPKHKRFKGKV